MIKLPYGYGINGGANSYTFGKILIDKDGKDYLTSPTYPSNIKQCLLSLLRIKQRELVEKENMELHEAIKKLDDLQNEFAELLKIIKEEI